jgi:Asp-tRNA(Asn)/Glu-tRNA(Gln) amidotransferase A subunit family amidase
MPELTSLSAAALARKIRSGKVSPLEAVQAYIAKIEKLNPTLNAFVHVDAEAALRQARATQAGAIARKNMGLLHGVPISIKSSIDVAGMRCEAGSKLLAGRIADSDAPLVQRLRKAGAIVLGVTNSPELLMAWETDNILYGRTKNPWDLSRTPGGSSGGEAAAIAAGLSAGGVGSDGGGSIRVPAHFTGICGLKPTPGRVPATGHHPSSVGPFALTGVVGPMARTVEDLTILFSVIQGPDDGDPVAAPVPLRWPGRDALKKTRVGYFEEDGRTPVTAETREATRLAAEGLRTAGFIVQSFLPNCLERARQLWWKFFGVTGGMLLAPLTRGREKELSPILREFSSWVSAEPAHTSESLLDMWMQRDVVRREVLDQMNTFPVWLCPVAAIPAFRHGERSWEVEGRCVKYLDAWSYCEWFNLLGFPAAVVPVGKSPEGLPIGVQIVGRPWQEETVLAIAREIEIACGPGPAPPI